MTIEALEPSSNEKHISGDILVGSKIIDDLSSGLYNSPASCLKELINNSYDADASLVDVLIKPDADFIAVEDNGTGMSFVEFERHFRRVSESHKRVDSSFTASGRPKIGKIGIGFIAANELCDRMEIHSTKAGSPELLRVTIDFEIMRTRTVVERKTDDSSYKKGDYDGTVTQDALLEDHFTKIYLKDVRESAREIMAGAQAPRGKSKAVSLYGADEETFVKTLDGLSSWSELDPYSLTMVGVSLNVPVPYAKTWIGENATSAVACIAEEVADLNFTVNYDGVILKKPIVLNADTTDVLTRDIDFEGENVKVRGYLYANHGIIRPEDLNGVLIRVRSAGVGEYVRDFLGYPSGTGQLFQRWISAELYVDDRLEDALNIDRRTLRETHPAYIELRDWLHLELDSFIADIRRHLYNERSQARNEQRRADTSRALSAVAEKARTVISTVAADEILEVKNFGAFSTGSRKKARSFTVAQVFDLSVEVASDVLPQDLAERFIAELSARMKGSG
jgi:hypothetical protein